jgi:hypothetical protein
VLLGLHIRNTYSETTKTVMIQVVKVNLTSLQSVEGLRLGMERKEM